MPNLNPLNRLRMEFVGLPSKKDRNEILQELKYSIENKNVLGICLAGAEELLTTAIVEIQETESGVVLVWLKKTDLHGYPIERNPVPIGDIKSVVRFKTLFDSPVYLKIREWRQSQDTIAA